MDTSLQVAVVGMAGRFPGSKNVEEYWENIKNGKELITQLPRHDRPANEIELSHQHDSTYVNARGVLTDIDQFDAPFFGFTSKEAEITDPQHRVLLECAWQALENGGIDPERDGGSIGVYVGSSPSRYLGNVAQTKYARRPSDELTLSIGNESHFLATKISYRLHLNGPSVSVSAACSTSLVAVHLAVQSLLSRECDTALAGGVCIYLPQELGYLYEDGGIASPDGHCRPFDASAAGIVGGNGAGIVVLRRLEDALNDRDPIHAVVRGSAMNNDGASKVGYTAPSVEAQAEVVAEAMAISGVEPDSISYVEAHGTGTRIGDAVELKALLNAFGSHRHRPRSCAIGSVKSNMGHLDAAAGIAGFIKAVSAIKEKEIPPSLNYESPNPEVDLRGSPFYVNSKLTAWPENDHPRRAGVSSFGMGGTNVHVILEEAPPTQPHRDNRTAQVLPISAKSPSALASAEKVFRKFLNQHASEKTLANVSFTLQTGRREFDFRKALVCRSVGDAIEAIDSGGTQNSVTAVSRSTAPSVAFMFPGYGSQYVNMGRDLYHSEPVFKQYVDECAGLFESRLSIDLQKVMFPSSTDLDDAAKELQKDSVACAALFSIEYSLAKLWIHWGVKPGALIGHSLGELVAATLSEVFSLPDAASAVVTRGQLLDQAPTGAMLAIPLEQEKVLPLLNNELSLSAANEPRVCVVGGAVPAIDSLEAQFKSQGIVCHRLSSRHAYHSWMIRDLARTFENIVGRMDLGPPRLPFISNVTGEWIKDDEATDPQYWGRQMSETVRFSEGITNLLSDGNRVLIEVGPGTTLTALASRSGARNSNHVISNSMPREANRDSEADTIMNCFARLWCEGSEIDWRAFSSDRQLRRVALPGYSLERQRYWVETHRGSLQTDRDLTISPHRSNIDDLLYEPTWIRSNRISRFRARLQSGNLASWLIFVDQFGLGDSLARRLARLGHSVTLVRSGLRFLKSKNGTYRIRPNQPNDFSKLIEKLTGNSKTFDKIVYLWTLDQVPKVEDELFHFEKDKSLGYRSLLHLVQALAKHKVTAQKTLCVFSNGVHDVSGRESLNPSKSMLLGICKVVPQEHPNIICTNVDVVLPSRLENHPRAFTKVVSQFFSEIVDENPEPVVALRGEYRWTQHFSRAPLTGERATNIQSSDSNQRFTLLITGGLGQLGLAVSKVFAEARPVNLVLIGRSQIPNKAGWKKWIETHGETNDVSLKIKDLIRLEALGARVLPVNADVSDEIGMRQAWRASEKHFGTIHGVIHAAGVLDEGSNKFIEQMDEGDSDLHFVPKVLGTMVLAKLVKNKSLEFVALCSSLSSILGGLGMLAYASANIFMDSFAAKQHRRRSTRWITVNMDTWTPSDPSMNHVQTLRSTPSQALMSVDQAAEVLVRILTASLGHQVLVSSSSLGDRIREWTRFYPPLPAISSNDVQVTTEEASVHSLPVPEGPGAEAPANPAEQQIARILATLFGLENVDREDRFLELGGHSLLAVQLINRLNQDFDGVEFSVRSLLEDNPSVAELAIQVS